MSIPDGETLFRYAKPEILPVGQTELPSSIFNDPELSCDWKKHRHDPKTAPHVENGRNLVVSITTCEEIRSPKNPKRAGEVVPAWKQKIVHDPIQDIEGNPFTPNQAHSLIKGKKKAAVTSAIRDNSDYTIVASGI